MNLYKENAWNKDNMTVADWKKIFTLRKRKNGYAVASYLGEETCVVIPEKIGDEKVIAIASETFSPREHYISDAQKSCRENITQVIIPDTVTSIESKVFEGCKELKSVSLSNAIDKIESWTFQDCNKLESIVIPNGVREIGCCAFLGCNFSSVELPNGVTKIGWDAFANCSNLKSVIIPSELTDIGHGAFRNCKQLENIAFSSSKSFSLVWKILDKGQKDVLLKKAIEEKSNVPEIVKKIKANKTALLEKAFQRDDAEAVEYLLSLYNKLPLDELDGYIEKTSASPLSRAVIVNYKIIKYTPEKQAEFEQTIFEKEIGIKEKNLADWKKIYTLEKIKKGEYVYQSESGYLLKGYKGKEPSFVVPDRIGKEKIVMIGENAFSPSAPRLTEEQRTMRKNIESIILPKHIKGIQQNAFYNCESLKHVEIPNGVKWIDNCAFNDCTSLTFVSLPDSVEVLEGCAFMSCKNLESIVLSKKIKYIDMYTFYSCTNLKSIKIPESVTQIEREAFAGCTLLESIEIPMSVIKIANDAFKGCKNLIIYGSEGSYAENYAKKKGINFIAK